MTEDALGLFGGIGVELEYMIVDQTTLDVRPLADELLRSASGRYDMEVDLGRVSWSNELALHVVELKCTDPVESLTGLDTLFQEHVARMERALAPLGARLLGTAMHPWMDPHGELRLWPHGHDEIYATFDRIFDCRGHGWANLQSVHVNLPFADDDEFGRLHAAIRVLLPIVPGLAASSPLADGRLSGLLDTRLDVYRHNADRVPSVSGQVVPEAVFTRADYEQRVLQPLYADLAPLDPDGILRHEWVNARGCIARFDRMAIEIRLIDAQECPQADVAVAAVVESAVRALVEERWSSRAAQQAWTATDLSAILGDVTRDADQAMIRHPRFPALFGLPASRAWRAGELWRHLIETTMSGATGWGDWLTLFSREGCLARRIARAVGAEPDRERLHHVYGRLADCLRTGRFFDANAA